MKIIVLLVSVLVLIGCGNPDGEAHWGYSGNEGQENWGELSSKYRACSNGKNQSPINITGVIESELEPLKINYKPGESEILNNGHTVQVNYTPGGTLSADGHEFELKQYHFHTPSENTINGKSFVMEVHLVHADKDGNLAVIAVMFVSGKANEALSQAWNRMPKKPGDKYKFSSTISAEGLLPSNRDYFQFNGSLTTPPCSEGVRWFVMKEPISASVDQLKKFSDIIKDPNNRSVQPINARNVLQ